MARTLEDYSYTGFRGARATPYCSARAELAMSDRGRAPRVVTRLARGIPSAVTASRSRLETQGSTQGHILNKKGAGNTALLLI